MVEVLKCVVAGTSTFTVVSVLETDVTVLVAGLTPCKKKEKENI